MKLIKLDLWKSLLITLSDLSMIVKRNSTNTFDYGVLSRTGHPYILSFIWKKKSSWEVYGFIGVADFM